MSFRHCHLPTKLLGIPYRRLDWRGRMPRPTHRYNPSRALTSVNTIPVRLSQVFARASANLSTASPCEHGHGRKRQQQYSWLRHRHYVAGGGERHTVLLSENQQILKAHLAVTVDVARGV